MLNLDRCAFSVGSIHVSLREALSFGMLSRITEKFEDEVLFVEAGVAQADKERATPSKDAVQSRFNEWRKRMNLLSGDEMDAWLGFHGLSLMDMQEYLIDQCVYDALAHGKDDLAVCIDEVSDPAAKGLKTCQHILCSGQLTPVLEQVAARISIGLGPCYEDRLGEVALKYADSGTTYAWGARLAKGLGTPEPIVTWLTGLDASYAVHVEDRTTLPALRKAMAMNPSNFDGTDWMCTRWPNEGQAAEVARALSVRRGSLKSMAVEQRRPHWRESLSVEAAATKYADGRVHGLRPGEVLRPVRDGEGYVVRQLVKRTPSYLGSQSTMQAVERWVVDVQMRTEALAHVSFAPWVHAGP